MNEGWHVAFGRQVRMYRERKGMTQKQVAVALGYDRSVVSGWETGRRGEIGLHQALMLSNVLGVPLVSLLPLRGEF